MSVTFHILDAFARDKKIASEVKGRRYEEPDHEEKKFYVKPKPGEQRFTDHTGKMAIVHLFGKTADGKNIRCDVKAFKPFFFIRAPDGPEETQQHAITVVRAYLKRHLKPEGICKTIEIEACKRKELFGYTQDKAVPMLRLTMPSLGLFRDVKNCFLNSRGDPELKPFKSQGPDILGLPFGQGAPTVYEANLDPMLRFLHLRNLKPCNWATFTGVEQSGEAGLYECDWEDIDPCDNPPAATAPFSLVSWDIECMSYSGGFPMATKDDPVIQIGSIVGRLGSPETEKHIFVLDTCDKIPEGKVYTFKKERDLLLTWFRWLSEIQPDIMLGYNIFGFDEKYVWERLDKLGLKSHAEVQSLNRLWSPAESGADRELMKLEEKRLSSSALGDNFLYLWNTVGRLRVDLYHYIKRGYPLPSYKLDDTSRYFLGETVKEVEEKADAWRLSVGASKQDPAVGRSVVLLNGAGDTLCEKVNILRVESNAIVIEIPDDTDVDEVAKWAIVKDDVTPGEMFKLHAEGGSEGRALIAKYCVQDCQLVLDLFKKLDVFNNSMSMANVCSVPVSYIFLRGQGVKIESLMFKYCYEREQCIKVLPGGGDGDDETYEGAIVLDPTPGFYTTPVGVADFASLYPSTIISENISHDTLVWVKDYADDGTLIAQVYGSDAYDGLPGVAYTDIEYDNMIDDPQDTRKVKRKIKAGTRVCRYAQDRVGTIPRIVAGLLAARKAKRKEGEKATDPFVKALLDSEQLAYKLTANSLYGQLGSGTFKIRMRYLAASVTAYGRKQIMFSKHAIETFYGPSSGNPRSAAEIVYGDTDSLFVAFHPKNPETGQPLEGQEALEATIHLTEEAGKFVSKMLKAPHDFEFDKVYYPFIIFSKKRYVGHKYEDPDHPDKFKLAFMGVALKRRDYAAIVKRIYSAALNVLLNERDVPKAAGLVQDMSIDLVEGKYGLQPLTISKSLKAEYKSNELRKEIDQLNQFIDKQRARMASIDAEDEDAIQEEIRLCEARIEEYEAKIKVKQQELARARDPAHKVLADRIAERDPGNAPASGDRIPYVYIQPQVGQEAPDLQGERIETPTYIKEKGLKPDYMYYIDHQIANPVCQIFGIVVDQIPGFESQPAPRGGWSEDPEKRAVQRETVAYNLLFQRALDIHNKGRMGAFVAMLGATVETTGEKTKKPRVAGARVVAPADQVVKKQSTLDSMFMAKMQNDALKQVLKTRAPKKVAAPPAEGESASVATPAAPKPRGRPRKIPAPPSE